MTHGRGPPRLHADRPAIAGSDISLRSTHTDSWKESAMPFDLSVTQVVIVLVIALLVFGPRRLPDVGRGLGQGLRELRSSLRGTDTSEDGARP